MNIRIGIGIDIHPLVPGRDLWVGGVKIPSEFGAEGHSDADALIHAICDALLGAANIGDIGKHFPPSDPQYKDIDSKILLANVAKLIAAEGYSIGNIDSMVLLEKPKLLPHVPAMALAMAKALGIMPSNISIKASTAEKLGFVGRGEGIEAHAVAIIHRNLG